MNVVTQLFLPELNRLMTIGSFVVCGVLSLVLVIYWRRAEPERRRRKWAELQASFLADDNAKRTTLSETRRPD
ncbi:MAG: hypothetical protein ABI216_11945 [Devosia sp.]